MLDDSRTRRWDLMESKLDEVVMVKVRVVLGLTLLDEEKGRRGKCLLFVKQRRSRKREGGG